ncbi:hypothetical protein QYF50_06420 [Paenibacillus vini]|uniref:hypothetical protein n=1 Tax=Paenibacillus vini TaxID=1476024 RepID=UPI0025B66F1A|nr:hypothetical protein [Paenibacillus vini]MDN4067525.1 hypothetical protein [Paenibacillus vini]
MEQILPLWKQAIDKIESCPQRQDATMDQLIDLHYVAIKLGFYDAADAIKLTFINKFNEHEKYTIMEQVNGLLDNPMAAGAYKAGILDTLKAIGISKELN